MNVGPSRNITGSNPHWNGSHPDWNDFHPHKARVRAFVALNLAGGIGLVLVLITAALSRTAKRTPTWYSFCFSWVFYAVSYSLLFLAGEQTNPTPINSLCSTQAALIYALPPTTSCTTLALLLHVLLIIPDALGEMQIGKAMTWLLLLGPYTIFLSMFVGQLVSQSDGNPARKGHRGTYCQSANHSWLRVSYAVVAVVTMAIIFVQGQIAIQLSHRSIRQALRDYSGLNVIRVMIFTLIGGITLVMAVMFTAANKHNITFDLIISIFPLLTFLVFGTQMDLLRSWLFWRSPRPNTETTRISAIPA